ncbi:type II secretion system protein N [Roseobacter sp. EG26]|uniref:type II secretion system protein N n=1 Tax=Roseobacter sp. EG26 TaxID=3412477 RepID=UPI003CE523E8
MKFDPWHLGQLGIGLLVAGPLIWQMPSVVRHSLGIVVLEQPERTINQTDTDDPTVDLTALLAFRPFGRAAAEATIDFGAPTNALPDLTLNGVLKSARAEASAALISVADVQDLFREGDPISEGLRVESVASDHVVICSRTKKIILTFEETQETEGEKTKNAAAETPINDRLRAAAVVADRTSRTGLPETTQEYIAYWRQKIRKNPQAVLDTIGLEPVGDGYRIAQKHNRGVRLAGLQAGDLVRSVNGKSVGNPKEDRKTYDAIAASGQARIEVQRGDRLLTFSFPLR